MIALVDSNEQATAPRIVDMLRKEFPTLQVAKLQFGDVNIIDKYGRVLAVERKTPSDMLSSIGDGRIFSQVERMSAANWSAIIVTGVVSYGENDMVMADGSYTNWHGNSVRNALAACQWSGCPVVFTSKGEYAHTVRELVDFLQKPSQHQQFQKRRSVTFPPIDETVDILGQFPGIGPKRSEAMLRFVGSNGGIGTLSRAIEWGTMCGLTAENVRPEGWGDKTIENFRKALGLGSDQYMVIRQERSNNGKESS